MAQQNRMVLKKFTAGLVLFLCSVIFFALSVRIVSRVSRVSGVGRVRIVLVAAVVAAVVGVVMVGVVASVAAVGGAASERSAPHAYLTPPYACSRLPTLTLTSRSLILTSPLLLAGILLLRLVHHRDARADRLVEHLQGK